MRDVPDPRTQALSKTVGIQWRAYDFGLRESRVRAQASQVQAAAAGLRAAWRQLMMDTAQQYYAAQAAHAQAGARERTVALARQMLQSTQNRLNKGLADQAEALQARSHLARAEYELSASLGEAAKAHAQLGQTLGLPGAAAFRLNPSPADGQLESGDETDAPRQDLQSTLGRLQRSHPALQAARAQLDAARHGVKATEREGLPSIDLSWNQYENGRPDQSVAGAPRRERSAAITLRLPLFDGYAQTYRVRAAQAQVAQRQAEVDAAEAQVRKDVVFTVTEAQAALSNLRAARQLALAAREATESVQRKFDRGAADLQQLTPALMALTQARAELAHSWARWQAARLRLHILASRAAVDEE